MSKPKYIALVILSLLFSVAWLLGLYVSLGLSGFSTERRMWLFIPSLLCLVPSWFIDKRLKKESYKIKPQISIGFCLFLSFFGLALVYGLPYILPYSKSRSIAQKYAGRVAGIYCLFLVRHLQQVNPFYTGA